MRLDKNAILNSLTQEDIKKIVTSLGSATPKMGSNGELICQTICHNKPSSSNSWKLYLYPPNEEKKSKRWTAHCYSGCSESFGIIDLIIRAKQMQGETYTFYKALQYIAQITGKLHLTNDIVAKPKTDIIDWSFVNQFINLKSGKREAPILSAINENILEIFDYHAENLNDWLKEGMSREALNRFEIGYYGYSNCLTIPHRNINGDLVGIRGRFLNERDVQEYGKYMPLQIDGKFLNHSLGNNLYGIHVSQDAIKRTGKVMLVEAEKSCLQAFTCYGDDSFVVATCGNRISLNQRKILLNTLKVSEIILAFDRDYKEPDSYEAERVYKLYLKQIYPLLNYCHVSMLLDTGDLLGYKDSPTDRGKAVLEELLDNKHRITIEEANRILSA